MAIDMIKFTRGVPPPISFPTERLISITTDLLKNESSTLLQYGNSYGYFPLREMIASQFQVDVDRVVLGQGSLQLLDHLLRIEKEKLPSICIEEPTYDRTITIFNRAKAKLTGIPITSDGFDGSYFEKMLAGRKEIDYLYIIPDFQNPSGTIMDLDTRKRIIELAKQHNYLIIEDSPYRRLRYEGEDIPSCFEISPDNVIHMSSFSKLVCPGLRVGFMILPANLAKQVAKIAEDTYINPSFLNQALVFRFSSGGFLDEHLIILKNLYNTRRQAMFQALDDRMADLGEWTKPKGGFFVGLTLSRKVEISSLMKAASSKGLQLTDGRGFFIHGGETFIRLPFCALTPAQIQQGISRLQSTILSLEKT